MAARTNVNKITERAERQKAERLVQFAESILWVQPRFTRWAMARVPHQESAKDLSLQQLTVLNLVRTEGLGLAELARRCMVAPTVITGIVDRLERQGLIRREADPNDRRVNRLVLTDAGQELSAAVEQGLVAEIAGQLGTFSDVELTDLQRGLELFDRLNAGLADSRGRKVAAA
jgi:DNA-binding MarR family transcriptional regulator